MWKKLRMNTNGHESDVVEATLVRKISVHYLLNVFAPVPRGKAPVFIRVLPVIFY